MKNEILNMVKDQVSKLISNNTQIPEEKKDQTVETTASSLVSGLKQHISDGNISDLQKLFSGDRSQSMTNNSGLSNTLQTSVISALTKKVGLNSGIATTIATMVVPAVLKMFSKKGSDPNDKGFNLQSLLGAFGGGSGSKIASTIGKIFG